SPLLLRILIVTDRKKDHQCCKQRSQCQGASPEAVEAAGILVRTGCEIDADFHARVSAPATPAYEEAGSPSPERLSPMSVPNFSARTPVCSWSAVLSSSSFSLTASRMRSIF